jgi:hypothetical protein
LGLPRRPPPRSADSPAQPRLPARQWIAAASPT